jgi:hypothetical protein
VKARVSVVGVGLARATRSAALVAASGHNMNAVPSCAALAPASNAAAIWVPVCNPPAAIKRQPGDGCGSSASTARTAANRSSNANGSTFESANDPWWPPASAPWTINASAPARAAAFASSPDVTVIHTSMSCACSSAILAESGSPNVNDTTAGCVSSTTSSLSSKWSSSNRGVPSSTPAAAAIGAISSA